MDYLFLRQISIPAIIGVHPQEQATPQIIYLDLEMPVEALAASMNDELASTLDYASVYQYTYDYVSTARYQLLETLGIKLADVLIEKFSLDWIRLTITKKPADLTHLTAAGITIERKSTAAAIDPRQFSKSDR